MRQVDFIYDKCGYSLSDVYWIEKPGDCRDNDESCPMCYQDDDGKLKCKNTLIGHCCKHVVKGNANEKERYQGAMSEWEKDDSIPDCIQSEHDNVIKNYEELTYEISRNPSSVSITGENGKVRILCDGAEVLDGATDFLSIEPFWEKDRIISQLIGRNGRKQLGIISAYFNFSSSDIYVMYRLTYQRYFERRQKGKNVSPAIKRIYDPTENILSEIIPEIDMAFDQARLFYRDKKNENYSAGVMFYFYWSKYVETGLLQKMYQDMENIFIECRKPGRWIWDKSERPESKKTLKSIIKVNENVYSARTLMEYIKMISGSDFIPEMPVGKEGSETPPCFTDSLRSKVKAGFNKRASKQFEMIFQRYMLERISAVFDSSYTKGSLEKIARFISENEMKDSFVGSVADHASFSLAYNLTKYSVALYVFCNNCKEIYGSDHSQIDIEFIRNQIKKWSDHKNQFMQLLQGSLFKEWLKIFEDLLRIEKKLKEIENY